MKAFFRAEITQHQDVFDPDCVFDFIDAFLVEKAKRDKDDPIFNGK